MMQDLNAQRCFGNRAPDRELAYGMWQLRQWRLFV